MILDVTTVCVQSYILRFLSKETESVTSVYKWKRHRYRLDP